MRNALKDGPSTGVAIVVGDRADIAAAVKRELISRGRTVVTEWPSGSEPTHGAEPDPDGDWTDLVRHVQKEYGEPGIFVHCWGSTTVRRNSIGTNAQRALNAIEALVGPMRAMGFGRIVLVSGREWLGWPGRASASADMAGLIGLTRSLALDLGRDGITVNAVCPPDEVVEPVDASRADEDPWRAPPAPLIGSVDPADVAYVVGFLTDDEAGYTTGQVVHASGGLSILGSLTA